MPPDMFRHINSISKGIRANALLTPDAELLYAFLLTSLADNSCVDQSEGLSTILVLFSIDLHFCVLVVF